MPIYEYRCDSCGHELEKLQRMSDEPLTDCPSCEESALRRMISAAGFRLKGSGWYETDFKTGKKRNLIGAESGSGNGEKAKSADDGSGSAKESTPAEGTKKEKSSPDTSTKSAGKDKTAA